MKAAKASAALVAALAVSLMVFVGLVGANNDDIILRGPVTAVSPNSISVHATGGVKTALLNAQTEIYIGDSDVGVQGTVDDIEVGTEVKVKAFQGGSGLVADEIEIESDDSTVTPTATPTSTSTVEPTVTPTGTPDEDDVEFSGVIAEVGPGEIRIAPANGMQTVLVDDSTVVREGGEPRTLGDLAVGQTVQVQGHIDGDSIVAERITIADGDDDGDHDEFDVTGKVTEVAEASVTIDMNGESMTFVVTFDTEFDAEHDGAGSSSGPSGATAHADDDDDDDSDDSDDDRSIADVKVGQWVRIEGRHQGDTLVAEEVRILNDEFADSLVEGVLSALEAGALTVDTGNGARTFEVNSNTEVEHENGDDGSFGDLTVGRKVRVSVEDDAMDVAHHITILDGVARPHSEEDEIWGQVMSVDPDTESFVLGRAAGTTTVLAGAGVEIKNADGSDGSFQSIAVGMFVKVHGALSDAGFEAREIELFNEAHEAGVIKRVSDGSNGTRKLVVLAGGLRRLVLVDGGTQIVRPDGKRLTVASLKRGAVVFVEATGRKLMDASRIVVAANRRGILRVNGNVAARVNNVLRVKAGDRLVALKLRPGTVLLLRNGRPVGAGALKNGAKVTVVGYATAAGRMVTLVRIGG